MGVSSILELSKRSVKGRSPMSIEETIRVLLQLSMDQMHVPQLGLISNQTRYLLMAELLLLGQVVVLAQLMITIMEFHCCSHACVGNPPSKQLWSCIDKF
ncbi:hypothetical protein V6N12_041725 [Hibiscus sabdariffa]|uniref:Uncharacterized protein n=1 Tax=Hibiscus sabdariffa TaxID=183260 RepID=A0ABR2A159_9ROSI